MKPRMTNTAYLQTTTRNEYGDFVSSGETTLPCHFRRIEQEADTSGNQVVSGSETVRSDAMAWFESGSGVERNSILRIDGDYWRVERLTEARRPSSPAVLFIKTELARYGVIS